MACCQGQVFGASGVIGGGSSARRAPFWPLWYDERCRREKIEETKRGSAILTITFSDATGITPGDEDEYARVLVKLWQDPSLCRVEGRAYCMRRFLEERRVPDAAAQWAYDNLPHTDAHRAVLSHPGLGENASPKRRASSYRRLRSEARSATLAWRSPMFSITRHSRAKR